MRLGAVTYLNARPLVYGLDRCPGVSLRFDVPARCAELLHADAIDVGLIPSIEYLNPPAHIEYRVVPDLAVGSDGPVASVALFTTRAVGDIRSIALDTSSRSSVALVRVLCRRVWGITPAFVPHEPDLPTMLASADAAVLIGDRALMQASGLLVVERGGPPVPVEKIDLGETWTKATGLPFVFAVWTGRAGRLTAGDLRTLRQARDGGVRHVGEIARAYYPGEPERQAIAERYLRDNIRYGLGAREQAGLERFYEYAAEAGVVERVSTLRFY